MLYELIQKFAPKPIDITTAKPDIKRIVIVHTDHIGDVMMFLPLLHTLHEQWPQAELICIVHPYAKDSLQAVPYIKRVIAFPFRKSKAEVKILAHSLSCDLVFCLTHNCPALNFTRLVSERYRVGFVYNSFDTHLFTALHTLNHYLPIDEKSPHTEHQVERYARLCQTMGITFNLSCDLPVDATETAYVADFARTWESLDIVFHLHSKWLTRNEPRYKPKSDIIEKCPVWQIDNLADLIERLLKLNTVKHLLITYGPHEKKEKLADQLLAGLQKRHISVAITPSPDTTPDPNKQVLLVSDLHFQRWAALLAKARLVITTDTGAAHVAAAVHTKVIDVFPYSKTLSHWVKFYPWQGCGFSLLRRTPEHTIARILEKAEYLLDDSNDMSQARTNVLVDKLD